MEALTAPRLTAAVQVEMLWTEFDSVHAAAAAAERQSGAPLSDRAFAILQDRRAEIRAAIDAAPDPAAEPALMAARLMLSLQILADMPDLAPAELPVELRLLVNVLASLRSRLEGRLAASVADLLDNPGRPLREHALWQV